MSRLSRPRLLALAESMTERERSIVRTIGQLRLVAGKQLERLYFASTSDAASRARVARRVLADLSDQKVLYRLERRIGGVRAGSAGHIYGLGAIGKRLLAYWDGEGLAPVRSAYEPSALFVRHTLAIGEQYVQLIEHERAGGFELVEFQPEPDCWRDYNGSQGRGVTLKPDALVRLGVGEFEQRSFVEVDCGTEGRGALTGKCRQYIDYFQTGTEQTHHGVFPRVVWLTTNQARVRLIVDVCASLSPDHWQLFGVAQMSQSLDLLLGRSVPGESAPGQG